MVETHAKVRNPLVIKFIFLETCSLTRYYASKGLVGKNTLNTKKESLKAMICR